MEFLGHQTLRWGPFANFFSKIRDGHAYKQLLMAPRRVRDQVNPRDKIYSLVGLAGRRLCWNSPPGGSPDKDWIPIDYSKSAVELFYIMTMIFQAETPWSLFKFGECISFRKFSCRPVMMTSERERRRHWGQRFIHTAG